MKTWIAVGIAAGTTALVLVGHFISDAEQVGQAETSSASADHQLPATTRITRSPDLATLNPSDSTYRVTCRVVSDKMSFHTPSFTVRDGEQVTISDTSSGRHVIATRTEGDVSMPIARELQEGSTFSVTVLAVDQHNVVVDAAATLQSVRTVAANGKGDSVRLNTLTGRFIVTSRLGEKSSATFGQNDAWTLQVTVERSPGVRSRKS